MASGHSFPQINLSVQGGTQGVSHKMVSLFSGRQKIAILNARPSSSTTKINMARIKEMVQMIDGLHEISSETGLNYGFVQHIVSDVLRF
ncbi:hypothetical protein TNCV_2541351 [Trichonephila clavipes]|nr:hypothetical protein TNCV_2541351 [Trichonephila clavipes]